MRIPSFCAFDNFVRIMASRVSVIYIYIFVTSAYRMYGVGTRKEEGASGSAGQVEVFNAARRQGAEEEVSRS